MLACNYAAICFRLYLEFSRKRIIIKENINDGVRLQFLLQTFSNLSKLTTNETLQQLIMQGLTSFSELYTSPLKCHFSRRLVPVHGCNLALLPDNCNA